MSKAKTRAKAFAIKPFRDEKVNEYYKMEGEDNSWCYEWGIDSNGNIYFAYRNGVVDRFKRREFIKIARQERNVF